MGEGVVVNELIRRHGDNAKIHFWDRGHVLPGLGLHDQSLLHSSLVLVLEVSHDRSGLGRLGRVHQGHACIREWLRL